MEPALGFPKNHRFLGIEEKRRSGVMDFIYIKSEHSEVRFVAEAGDIFAWVILKVVDICG